MPAFPEGRPCWADVTVPDLAAGERFYGELFGWTFREGPAEYGHYTVAEAGGRAAAGLVPPMPGEGAGRPAVWTLYFASPDLDATAARIREHGGEMLVEPMPVGESGGMLLARAPGGVDFAVWQAGEHVGFGGENEPGLPCWSEVVTQDAAATDAFFPAVFPFEVRTMEGPPELDYRTWEQEGVPVAGRYAIPVDASAEVVPHAEVYFAVADCDEAAAMVAKLGGAVRSGPDDSPYGRMAAVTDPNGAPFSVIDVSTTVGEAPPMR